MTIIKTIVVAATLAVIASSAFAAPRYYDARGAYASSFGTDTSRDALVQTSQ